MTCHIRQAITNTDDKQGPRHSIIRQPLHRDNTYPTTFNHLLQCRSFVLSACSLSPCNYHLFPASSGTSVSTRVVACTTIMFTALSHLAQWHSAPSTHAQTQPPQSGLVSRLTSLARHSQSHNTSTTLDLHDALDLDVETRKTILWNRLRNVRRKHPKKCFSSPS